MIDQFTTTPNRYHAPWYSQPADGPRLYWNPEYLADLDARSTESDETGVPHAVIPKTEINPWRGDPAASRRKTCPECGNPFTPIHMRAVTCSQKCQKARDVKRVTASKERRRAERAQQKRPCSECGTGFYHQNPQVVTCSDECRRARNRRMWQASNTRNKQRRRERKASAA